MAATGENGVERVTAAVPPSRRLSSESSRDVHRLVIQEPLQRGDCSASASATASASAKEAEESETTFALAEFADEQACVPVRSRLLVVVTEGPRTDRDTLAERLHDTQLQWQWELSFASALKTIVSSDLTCGCIVSDTLWSMKDGTSAVIDACGRYLSCAYAAAQNVSSSSSSSTVQESETPSKPWPCAVVVGAVAFHDVSLRPVWSADLTHRIHTPAQPTRLHSIAPKNPLMLLQSHGALVVSKEGATEILAAFAAREEQIHIAYLNPAVIFVLSISDGRDAVEPPIPRTLAWRHALQKALCNGGIGALFDTSSVDCASTLPERLCATLRTRVHKMRVKATMLSLCSSPLERARSRQAVFKLALVGMLAAVYEKGWKRVLVVHPEACDWTSDTMTQADTLLRQHGWISGEGFSQADVLSFVLPLFGGTAFLIECCQIPHIVVTLMLETHAFGLEALWTRPSLAHALAPTAAITTNAITTAAITTAAITTAAITTAAITTTVDGTLAASPLRILVLVNESLVADTPSFSTMMARVYGLQLCGADVTVVLMEGGSSAEPLELLTRVKVVRVDAVALQSQGARCSGLGGVCTAWDGALAHAVHQDADTWILDANVDWPSTPALLAALHVAERSARRTGAGLVARDVFSSLEQPQWSFWTDLPSRSPAAFSNAFSTAVSTASSTAVSAAPETISGSKPPQWRSYNVICRVSRVLLWCLAEHWAATAHLPGPWAYNFNELLLAQLCAARHLPFQPLSWSDVGVVLNAPSLASTDWQLGDADVSALVAAGAERGDPPIVAFYPLRSASSSLAHARGELTRLLRI
jgi:hypothetical protein